MDSPLPPSDLAEYPVSEVDSLSDSDWLDIPSSRESDDLDSVCSQMSSRDGRGHSRHSSTTSDEGSRDGEVDVWEGILEDAVEEGLPDDRVTGTLRITLPVIDAVDRRIVPDRPVRTAEELSAQMLAADNVDDEERVTAGLDQSLASTLSSSRSGSLGNSRSTVHSTRDFRLSFPDPLTSSCTELDRSFEDIAPSDETVFTTDNDDGALSSSVVQESPSEPKVESSADIEDSHSPRPPDDAAPFSNLKPDLDVVIYGRSSSIKWQFVHELLLKIESASAETSDAAFEVAEPDPCKQCVRGLDISFPNGVNITDRTELTVFEDWEATATPSLAVVYLPASPCALSEHTYYLPVLAHSEIKPLARVAAWASWRKLRIPNNKHLPLIELPVMGLDHLKKVPGVDLRDGLRGRTTHLGKRTSTPFATLAQASGFLAVLMLMISLFLEISFRAVPQAHVPKETPATAWSVATQSTPNHSAATASNLASESCALIPSSLKDFALAVFNPVPPSPTAPHTADSSTTKPRHVVSEKLSQGKELIQRPLASLTLQAHSKALSIIVPAQKKAEAITNSVSIRLTDSLSEIINMKAVMAVFDRDARELIAMSDEMMKMIERSTAEITAQAKRRAKVLCKRLQERHERAQKRAREWKEYGHRVIEIANEQIRSRASVAREKAHFLKEVTRHMWVTHQEQMTERKKRKRQTRKRVGSMLFKS